MVVVGLGVWLRCGALLVSGWGVGFSWLVDFLWVGIICSLCIWWWVCGVRFGWVWVECFGF